MTPEDACGVLGVSRSARPAEVRRAYLAMARRHHPDHGGDPAAMQRVNEAWTILRSSRRQEQRRVWSAPPEAPPDADIDLDDRPYAAPRRSFFDLVPAAIFASAVITACLALALDAPPMLGFAGFLFFLSCIAVAAVSLVTMRRSVRAERR